LCGLAACCDLKWVRKIRQKGQAENGGASVFVGFAQQCPDQCSMCENLPPSVRERRRRREREREKAMRASRDP